MTTHVRVGDEELALLGALYHDNGWRAYTSGKKTWTDWPITGVTVIDQGIEAGAADVRESGAKPAREVLEFLAEMTTFFAPLIQDVMAIRRPPGPTSVASDSTLRFLDRLAHPVAGEPWRMVVADPGTWKREVRISTTASRELQFRPRPGVRGALNLMDLACRVVDCQTYGPALVAEMLRFWTDLEAQSPSRQHDETAPEAPLSFEEFDDSARAFIDSIAEILGPEGLDYCRRLVRANESLIAFEHVQQCLHLQQVPISMDLYRQLLRLNSEMEPDRDVTIGARVAVEPHG